LTASLVITTRNRRDELRTALRSAAQQVRLLEIIVIDDGSTDGTADMVRAEFPNVIVHRREDSRGLIVRRNDGARLATGDVLFSIDDDAAFSTPHVVEQTVREFDDPRIGAVAIPYLEPNTDNCLRQKAPDRKGVWITDTFIGTAHALRRDIFLNLCGYREELVHQGEETDYCIRMLDAGFCVRLGTGDPIYHYESPRRDFRRMDFFGRRNDILFAWHNVPLARLPVHLVATTMNGLRTGVRTGRLLRMLLGTTAGYRDSISNYRVRNPVSSRIYCLNRRLKKRGPVTLESVGSLLAAASAKMGS
jgi:glycosyltransferase involved in cell wall biosynthesis